MTNCATSSGSSARTLCAVPRGATGATVEIAVWCVELSSSCGSRCSRAAVHVSASAELPVSTDLV